MTPQSLVSPQNSAPMNRGRLYNSSSKTQIHTKISSKPHAPKSQERVNTSPRRNLHS